MGPTKGTEDVLNSFIKKVVLQLSRRVTKNFFMVGEFSLNYCTFINIHPQHKKERRHREKNLVSFRLKTLKKFHSN